MATTYQDSSGKYFKTHAEAAASNKAMGTNPAANAGTTSSPKTNSQTGGETSDFMKAIQDKLLGQSGIVSSTNSNLEKKLQEAIAGIGTATEKSSQGIESAYARERGYMESQASNAIQGQLEGRSGFATQMVAFRNLVETTDKSLKDLEMRKNELILANDAAGASKIADMQFKALEFKQQAEQQTFSNLLGMANFGIQNEQEKRLAKAQTFQENKAMSDIALQYGIDMKPGDTIDTITSKAMVFASEEQKARLAKMQAEIKYTNAQTAKVLNGDKDASSVKITPEITSKLAARWNELAATGATVDTSAEMENILGKYAKAGKEADFYDALAQDSVNKAKAQFETVKPTSPTTKRTLVNDVVPFGTAIQRGSAGFLNYLIGKDVFEKI